MSGERIWLFDTTLRDGCQARGIDFSVADKVAIARALDEMGIDYIEGLARGQSHRQRFFEEFSRTSSCPFGRLWHDPPRWPVGIKRSRAECCP